MVTSAPLACAASTSVVWSRTAPLAPGYWSSTPKQSSSRSGSASAARSATTTSMPSGSARVRITAIVCGRASASTRKTLPVARPARRDSVIASAAAVASSNSDAPATGSPVRSDTIVWKFSSASSRPWEISGWYGVYAVYQAGFSNTERRTTGGVWVS